MKSPIDRIRQENQDHYADDGDRREDAVD